MILLTFMYKNYNTQYENLCLMLEYVGVVQDSTLFSSPLLQHFLNCTPMREAHSEKAIYQPGAMRKVSELVYDYHSFQCNYVHCT